MSHRRCFRPSSSNELNHPFPNPGVGGRKVFARRRHVVPSHESPTWTGHGLRVATMKSPHPPPSCPLPSHVGALRRDVKATLLQMIRNAERHLFDQDPFRLTPRAHSARIFGYALKVPPMRGRSSRRREDTGRVRSESCFSRLSSLSRRVRAGQQHEACADQRGDDTELAHGYFQVTSMPKKCMKTSRFGLFFGFCCGLRM